MLAIYELCTSYFFDFSDLRRDGVILTVTTDEAWPTRNSLRYLIATETPMSLEQWINATTDGINWWKCMDTTELSEQDVAMLVKDILGENNASDGQLDNLIIV